MYRFILLQAHDIDYIRWALEDEVKTVYATGSSSVQELEAAGVHDNATMVMTFSKGTCSVVNYWDYNSLAINNLLTTLFSSFGHWNLKERL